MPPKTVKKTYAKGWNKIGSRIRIPGKGANPEYEGILAFAGVTNPPLNPDKPDTKYVGIVLEEPTGLNDGSVKDKGRYFECKMNHGVFARGITVEVIAPPTPESLAFLESHKKPARAGSPKKARPTSKSPVKAVKKAAPAEEPMPELPDEDPEPLSPSVESVTSPPPASAPAPSVTQPPPVAAPAPSREVVPTVSSPVPAGDGSHQCYLCPECASVDKEIIALLREEVNDLTNEVLLLETLKGGSGGGGGDVELENEKLRMALAQLKEAYDMQTAHIAKKEQELKEARNPKKDTSGESIADLRKLVEHLSAREHEHVEEKDNLNNEIRELNALLLVSKNIENEALNWVEELKAELSSAYEEIAELESKTEDLKDEWKSKWTRLNRAYARLEDELAEARAGRGPMADDEDGDLPADPTTAENNAQSTHVESQPHTEPNTQSHAHGFVSVKERANGIEAELKTAESKLLTEQLQMVSLFLPPAYETAEKSGVEMVLFLRRVRAKCEVILKDTTREFKLDQDVNERLGSSGLSTVQLASAQALASDLQAIIIAIKALLSVMEQGHEGTYLNLSHNYMELKGHEPALDVLLEAIKVDALGPSTDLSKVRHAAQQFGRLVSNYVKEDNQNSSLEFLDGFFSEMSAYVASSQLELKRLQDIFSATTSEGEKDPAFDDTVNRLGESYSKCEEIARLLRKASKFVVNSPAGVKLEVEHAFRETLTATVTKAQGVAYSTRDTSLAVWTDMHSSATLKALRLDAAYKIAKSNRLDLTEDGKYADGARQQNAEEHMVPLFLPTELGDVEKTMATLVEDLEHGKYDKEAPEGDAPETTPPWVERGRLLQNAIEASLNFEKKCEEKDEQIAEKKRELIAESRKMSDMEYKLKLAEKRIRTAKSETDIKVDEVRAAKDALETDLRGMIDEKNKERQELEEEMAEIDRELKELKAKYNVGKPGSTAGVGDLKAASLQIYSLREALRELREELAAARGQAAVDALQALPPLPAQGLAGPTTTKPVMSIDSSLYSLMGELTETMANPLVVDISHQSKDAPSAKYQLAQEAARVHRLKSKGSETIHNIEKAFAERRPGANLRVAGVPEVGKALSEANGVRAAVIRIPTTMAKSKGGTHRVTVGLSQFRALHSEFTR